MGILGDNPFLALGNLGTGYQIQQSLRFNSADNAYLEESNIGVTTTCTISWWHKKGSGSTSNTHWYIGSYPSGWTFESTDTSTNGWTCLNGGGSLPGPSGSKYRDYSAWYHWVFTQNGTTSTMWLNGVKVKEDTSNSGSSKTGWRIGEDSTGANNLNGYMAEFIFLDGTAVSDPDGVLGEFNNGVWRPIAYTEGNFGTDGFYLKFDPSAANGIGHDHSGNGNNFTANNFVTSGDGTDVMSDTPTTNWCTLNPLDSGENGGGITLSEGNLRAVSTASDRHVRSTFFLPTSGKWYWEMTATTVNTAGYLAAGLYHSTGSLTATAIATAQGRWYAADGYGNGSSWGDTYDDGDIIGIAVDMNSGRIWAAKNNTWQASGDPVAGTNPMYDDLLTAYRADGWSPVCANWQSGNTADFNFGQREFAYTPPTGFRALNTSNLPPPEIEDGSKYFKTVLYTGTVTDTSTQSVTGVGFKSDWTWIKRRDSGNSHQLVDAVRGAGSWLETNSNNQENSTNTNGVLTSFDADGFTLTGGSTNANLCCEDGFTYASWSWLAGGSTSSNTDGTISSTVSVNRKAGLSIVTYTGTGVNATVGHGLGVQPSFYVVKPRSESNNWPCWHRDLTSDSYYIHLNFALKQDLASTVWNGTGPSSTVFNIGTNTNVNQDEATFVAYVFAEVPGYSHISFYPGNGSTTGPFIWTGFRPSYLLIKNYRGGSETNWLIRDSVRSTYNAIQPFLYANTDAGEGNNFPIDFLSNGFKIRDDNAIFNESGSDLLFLAFAENPFGGFRATPVTAR